MTELTGFPPRWGFGPRSMIITGGMHVSVLPVRIALFSLAYSCRALSGGGDVWKRTFDTATHCGDRLTHTGLIQRDLPSLHRHKTWQERRGVIRSAVWSLPTEARASGPVWTTHTITTCGPKQSNRTDSNPPAGHTPVARPNRRASATGLSLVTEQRRRLPIGARCRRLRFRCRLLSHHGTRLARRAQRQTGCLQGRLRHRRHPHRFG